ncbi:hypothetical protein ACRCUN_01605 [Mycobacterium sp. LTG2003]
MSMSPPDPPRPEPMWDQLFELDDARRAGGRASVLPRALKRRRPNPALVVGAAAMIVVVAVVVLVVWLLRPLPSTESAPGTTESSEATDSQAQRRLAQLLPAGYSADACTPEAPSTPNALASVTCGENADPGGPPRATYTLLRDKAALSAAFDAVVASSTTVVCPGRIQSPGPWRRNATPDQVSGVLFCGTQQGHPIVAWTDDATLLLSEVHADEAGPTFPELYAWWSSHS